MIIKHSDPQKVFFSLRRFLLFNTETCEVFKVKLYTYGKLSMSIQFLYFDPNV